MAEVCYKMDGKADGSDPDATMSKSARRRRMEIRRTKSVGSGMERLPHSLNDSKRVKLGSFEIAASAAECSRCEKRPVSDGKAKEGKVTLTGKETVVVSLTRSVSSSGSLSCSQITMDFLGEYPKYGVSSVCGRRREMEDTFAVHPYFVGQGDEGSTALHYFGVYDGHGCSHAAMRCRERMHELIKEELISGSREWKVVMERSFSRMDEEVTMLNTESFPGEAICRCELQSPDCNAVGSTAVLAIVTADKIIVANCGDSRAVLSRKGQAFPLSSDHKPDRPDELDRIHAAGGRVIYWDGPRVLGVLAMSRAIGNSYLKPYVSCEPEVMIIDRTADDDCLILASDGLWDAVSNDTACGVVRMCLKGKMCVPPPSEPMETAKRGGERSDRACLDASMLLTKLALARHSTDNVSVVVVNLRRSL